MLNDIACGSATEVSIAIIPPKIEQGTNEKLCDLSPVLAFVLSREPRVFDGAARNSSPKTRDLVLPHANFQDNLLVKVALTVCAVLKKNNISLACRPSVIRIFSNFLFDSNSSTSSTDKKG